MLFLHQVCSVCTRILTETLIGGIVSYFRLPAFAHDSFVVASLWLTRPLSPHTPGHHTTLNTTQALLTPSYFPLSGYRAACIYGTRLQLLSSLRLHRYMDMTPSYFPLSGYTDSPIEGASRILHSAPTAPMDRTTMVHPARSVQ